MPLRITNDRHEAHSPAHETSIPRLTILGGPSDATATLPNFQDVAIRFTLHISIETELARRREVGRQLGR